MLSSTVIIVLWLIATPGHPAFDYIDRETCKQVQALTELQGKVTVELADGSELVADRVDCLELSEQRNS